MYDVDFIYFFLNLVYLKQMISYAAICIVGPEAVFVFKHFTFVHFLFSYEIKKVQVYFFVSFFISNLFAKRNSFNN